MAILHNCNNTLDSGTIVGVHEDYSGQHFHAMLLDAIVTHLKLLAMQINKSEVATFHI